MRSGEDGLRRLLRELRREEERAAPPFDRFRARGVPVGRPLRWRWALTGALAVVLLAVGVTGHLWRPAPSGAASAEELAAALSQWEVPLDFLLELPGQEFLSERPLPQGSARQLIELVESESFDTKEVM